MEQREPSVMFCSTKPIEIESIVNRQPNVKLEKHQRLARLTREQLEKRAEEKNQKKNSKNTRKGFPKAKVFLKFWCKNAIKRPTLLVLLVTTPHCLSCQNFFPFWKHWINEYQENRDFETTSQKQNLGVDFVQRYFEDLFHWKSFLHDYKSLPFIVILPNCPWFWREEYLLPLVSIYSANLIQTKQEFFNIVLKEKQQFCDYLTSNVQNWHGIQTLQTITSMVMLENKKNPQISEKRNNSNISWQKWFALWCFHFLNPSFKLGIPLLFSKKSLKKQNPRGDSLNWFEKLRIKWLQLCQTNWKLFYELYQFQE